MMPNTERTDCLIRCQGEHCSSSQCCARENLLEETGGSARDLRAISSKYDKRKVIPEATINLERFTVNEEEAAERSASDATSDKSAQKCPTNEDATRGATNGEREAAKRRGRDADDADDVGSCTIIINVTDQTSSAVVDSNRTSSAVSS